MNEKCAKSISLYLIDYLAFIGQYSYYSTHNSLIINTLHYPHRKNRKSQETTVVKKFLITAQNILRGII